MEFIKVTNPSRGVKDFLKEIEPKLTERKKVLWLVSGGSNIEIEADILSKIPDDLKPFLAVVLADERFGPPGHSESNQARLNQKGFGSDQARLIPTLVDPKDSFSDAVKRFNINFEGAANYADYVVAQFGIGEDGHIAGIKPGSPALNDKSLVTGYQAEDYKRISLTAAALDYIDSAYVFAFGANKKPQLEALKRSDLEPATQPAQLLKTIARVRIYNDQVGG